MSNLRIVLSVAFFLGTTLTASSASCTLEDAIYKSGDYTLRFSPIPDSPLYEYNLSITGLGLDVVGNTTVPNGFARAFYSIGSEGKSSRIGAIYFIWEKSKDKLTEDYALIDEPAPLATVLAEFSRTMYYTQRDQGEEFNIPPTDLFSFVKCVN
jgi:hypothetical protein